MKNSPHAIRQLQPTRPQKRKIKDPRILDSLHLEAHLGLAEGCRGGILMSVVPLFSAVVIVDGRGGLAPFTFVKETHVSRFMGATCRLWSIAILLRY